MGHQTSCSEAQTAATGASHNIKETYANGTFVIFPPSDLHADLQRLRQKYNPESYRLIGPHITVTQPLLAKLDSQTADIIGEKIGMFPSFTITCGPITILGDWLVFDIEPKSMILQIRNMIHAMGLSNLTLPYTDGFIPHLTIGKADRLEEEAQKLRRHYGATQFKCTEIAYGLPDDGFRFGVVQLFDLNKAIPGK